MEEIGRTLAVVFGPSRSRFFPKAVAYAQATATEVTEVEPERYRALFLLGKDPDPYLHLSALVERVRAWRGSEVYADGRPVASYAAKEMGWCASQELRLHGGCRVRFHYGIPRRCGACPLLDRERAEAELRGENHPPPMMFEIELGENVRRILRGDLSREIREEVPDFLPEDWDEPS